MMLWTIFLYTLIETILDSDLSIKVRSYGCYLWLLWDFLIVHVYTTLALIDVVPTAIIGRNALFEFLF